MFLAKLMCVWTPVFRSSVTGGRHQCFARRHEILLVRGLVAWAVGENVSWNYLTFGFRNLVRFYRYQLAGYAPLTAADTRPSRAKVGRTPKMVSSSLERLHRTWPSLR